jgi:hypothetical protein
MEKSKKQIGSSIQIGAFILGSAILWGGTIIGCSLKLKGTECFDEILMPLSLGAGFHLILIWGGLSAKFKKFTKGE